MVCSWILEYLLLLKLTDTNVKSLSTQCEMKYNDNLRDDLWSVAFNDLLGEPLLCILPVDDVGSVEDVDIVLPDEQHNIQCTGWKHCKLHDLTLKPIAICLCSYKTYIPVRTACQ